MKTSSKALLISLILCFFSSKAFCLSAPDNKGSENEQSTQNYDATVQPSNNDEQSNKQSSALAILQCLNKVSAKTSELRIMVGQEIKFGKLSIKVERCWKSAPEQRPESKILLDVKDTGIDGNKNRIFYGWMLSSSPSISGLEHPIYDITAIDCQYN